MKMKKKFYSKNKLILISMASAICCIYVLVSLGAIIMQLLTFLLWEQLSMVNLLALIIALTPETIGALVAYIIMRFLVSLRPPSVLHRIANSPNFETLKKDVLLTGDENAYKDDVSGYFQDESEIEG